MRNATLHRRFPGAAVRLHSFHNDAYSTVRSPNQRSPGRRIKSSPFIVDAQPRRPNSDAPLRTMSQSARGWLPADPHTIGSIRIVRQAFHFVFLVVFFLVVRTVVGLGEIDQHRQRNGTKVYSVSWRQSAETAANACSSKVIAGRFYDLGCEARQLRCVMFGRWSRGQKAAAGTVHGPIAAGKWTASVAKRKLDWRTTRRRKRGGIPCKIVCDRLYGSGGSVCWLPRRRVIRFCTVCARARDE